MLSLVNLPKTHKHNPVGLNLCLEGEWIFIGVHGGGERNFGDKHPTFAFFHALGCSKLYSMSLPLHNLRNPDSLIDKPEFDDADIPSVQEFLDAAFDVLQPVVLNKNVIFLGHSGGGMTIQRNWWRLAPIMTRQSIMITVGSGTVETERASVVNAFWTVDNYREMGSFDLMSKIHLNEERTQRLIKFWYRECGVGGRMYASNSDAQAMFVDSVPDSEFRRCFMIIGDRDEAFPINEVLSVVDKTFAANNVLLCSSGHFTYFAGEEWVSTRKAILNIIIKSCPLKPSSDEALAKTKKKHQTQAKL
eukprot:GDKJ01039771.1.p1 GENE.GDKJ01039771.1~~GDKJ01039771.1.p1  ORF type:complete len:304 (+),score=28.99 GDKJ01039771.1:13-924(+)